MNDSIVVIDSSDDEEPVLKKAKIEEDPLSLEIREIKSLVAKDVVVIEDDSEVEQTPKKPPNTQQTLDEIKKFKDITLEKVKTEIKSPVVVVKRIELTPVTEKTETHENFVEPSVIAPIPGPSETSEIETEIQENGISSTCEGKPNLLEDFTAFVNACKECQCRLKYKQVIEKKLPKLECKYNEADEHYIKSNKFKKLLVDSVARIKHKPDDLILIFSDVYKELINQRKREIELSDKDLRNLHNLQKVLKKVRKKIYRLENAECNWDDERNSEYLMVDSYKKRAALIHEKICSITKDDPYASRQIYKSLDISCSKYPEINRAIDKMYSKNKQFPSFYDVDRCIRKCVNQNNLDISDMALHGEISNMFKHVGELLKRRRRFETYEAINDLVEPTAEEEDPDLMLMMDLRHIENEKRIDEVLQKYVSYQEAGTNNDDSTDCDRTESEDSTDE